MSNPFRSQVLGAYKSIVRAQKKLFKEDIRSLEIGIKETKNKFYVHKNETDVNKIKKLIKNAEDSAEYIERHVIQGKLNDKGNYQLRITESTYTTTEETPSLRF